MPRIELCELWGGNPPTAIANQPKEEPIPEEASVAWFIDIMRLHSRGLTPGVSPREYMPSREALAQFFGPKASSGYYFEDYGLPEYEVYVRHLFRRVLQLPWPGYSPLPKADSENARRVLTPGQAPSNPANSTPSPVTARRIDPALKGNHGKGKQNEISPPKRTVERGESSKKGNRTIDEAAAIGLILLRPSFSGMVETERQRFIEARHDIGQPVHTLRSELAEEKERLKFFERKVAEKTGSYERVSEQYGRARDVYAAARFDETQLASKEQKTAMKNFTKNCEILVTSWFENLEVANTRLASWEFKLKRQTERISKMCAELKAAEIVYAEKVEIMDNSVVNLEAVANVLADL
ncbi:hypothetical protein KC19_5G162000 [Ceratodon purpureus]|uniref:Uncharacterized protein n=1 Tax=Ceratodon purpureus TaxID=3225 RepID=A0A8T0I244_CERPU|nr:hypothetical protein KC19_5G162000 [Ceratodon purpureus]